MFGAALVLKVDADVKEKVESTGVRAVKVVAEKETLKSTETVAESESLEEDFEGVAAILEDDKPCIVLVNLKGSPNHAETDWALIAYTPDNAPVKTRMLNASSVKPLKEKLEPLKFLEYQITEKDEATLAKFLEATHVMSEQERRDCMSKEERQIADVKKEQLKEQAAAPKMLAGLKNLKVAEQESFTEAMKDFLVSENKALKAMLTGDKGEELSGEVIDDVASPSGLKGKLPGNDSCFVIMKKEASKILFITWQPDDVPIKQKMKASTFKASVLDLVKEYLRSPTPEGEQETEPEILTAGANDEDELNDEMGNPRRKVTAEDLAEPQAPKPTGGYKPPCGGIAMPGMGGPRP